MNNKQNTYDHTNLTSYITLFLFQVQQQEKTHKMLEELGRELRQTNRFFPKSALLENIKSLSDISSVEMKKGTKLFRCRLVDKETEIELLKPYRNVFLSFVRSFIPEFDENKEIIDPVNFIAYFNDYPDQLHNCEIAYRQSVECQSMSPFFGYDKKNSDAPPPGTPTPGRINPDGISYLYMAEDIRTAILEVRPVPTQLVSVAQIELTEDIKVYSFTKTASSYSDSENLFAIADMM